MNFWTYEGGGIIYVIEGNHFRLGSALQYLQDKGLTLEGASAYLENLPHL